MKTTLVATVITACLACLSPAAPANEAKNQPCAPKEVATKPAERPNAAALAANTKADEERKAAALAAASKKADEEKKAHELESHSKLLGEQKARAEAERRKAEVALKAAERQVAAIDAECKKAAYARKMFDSTALRQAEIDKQRKIQEAALQDKAVMARMRSEIQELRRAVDHLSQQLATQRLKVTAPPR